MMSKFDEFLLVLTYYGLRFWKLLLPLVIAAIFFAGYAVGNEAEAGYLWTD